MVAERPLRDPPNLNARTPAHLKLTLVARPTRFTLAGRTVYGDSYDGDYVGPTLHFAPGEDVTLRLVNHLASATNLHFHGLHVAPGGSSDDIFISVPPGGSYIYHLHIPEDQPPGTYWYHDHDMCLGGKSRQAMPMMAMRSTPVGAGIRCMDIESQLYAGLSGAIVVGDDRVDLPPGLRHVAAHTLMFKDAQIQANGQIVRNGAHTSINSAAPTVRFVNGQLRPVLSMRPGQTELWRLINGGADIFYRLHLDGYTFRVVSQDGFPEVRAWTARTLLLPPGKRYDVLVTAKAHPGRTWLRTLAYSNGVEGDSYPEARLMRLAVRGAPRTPVRPATWSLSGAPRDLTDAPITRHRTVQFTENPIGTKFRLNGQTFNMNRSIFSHPAVVNTVEQWTLINLSGQTHPFHLHTGHFQVMSIDGVPQPFLGEQDIVDVPAAAQHIPSQVVIRIDFADFTGEWMFHCHIALHEDDGMMSFIRVVNPPARFNHALLVAPAY